MEEILSVVRTCSFSLFSRLKPDKIGKKHVEFSVSPWSQTVWAANILQLSNDRHGILLQ